MRCCVGILRRSLRQWIGRIWRSEQRGLVVLLAGEVGRHTDGVATGG